jgi:hypothetical protein
MYFTEMPRKAKNTLEQRRRTTSTMQLKGNLKCYTVNTGNYSPVD